MEIFEAVGVEGALSLVEDQDVLGQDLTNLGLEEKRLA